MLSKVPSPLESSSVNKNNKISLPSQKNTEGISSYANAVLKLQSEKTQQTLVRIDNNKENIVAMKPTDEETTQVTPQATVVPKEEPPVADSAVSNPVPEDIDDDDSNFVPVIGHKKGQARAKKRARDAKRPGPPSSEQGTRDKDHPAKGKSGRRRDRKGGNKDTKEHEKSDISNVTTVDSSGNSSDVNKSETETQSQKKFVEAPLPKVNAWKVRKMFNF